jgi:RNA polymerase sigma-70 factor (ECF subfamily)
MLTALATRSSPRDMMFIVRGKSGGTVLSNNEVSEPDEAVVAADLVRRIAAGDAAAEGELVERYRRGLLYLLHRLGALPDLAEDVQQETFIIAIKRLRHRGLDDPAGLAPFLRATARNLLIAEWRKTERRRTWGDSGELAAAVAPAPSQLQTLLLDEEAEIVRELIGELPTDRDRQILFRFYVGGQDKAKICADLGLDSLHFNRVLFRARKRFKELRERSQKRQNPPQPLAGTDGTEG